MTTPNEQELNDMGHETLRASIRANGFTAGAIHELGLEDAIMAFVGLPVGQGTPIKEQPVGSYLRSIGL